jgi:hypothetical protein
MSQRTKPRTTHKTKHDNTNHTNTVPKQRALQYFLHNVCILTREMLKYCNNQRIINAKKTNTLRNLFTNITNDHFDQFVLSQIMFNDRVSWAASDLQLRSQI